MVKHKERSRLMLSVNLVSSPSLSHHVDAFIYFPPFVVYFSKKAKGSDFPLTTLDCPLR